MRRMEADSSSLLLLAQVRWLIRLRWLAGLAVIVGGLANAYELHWYVDFESGWKVTLGLGILLYNVLLWLLTWRWQHLLPRIVLVWMQIVPDLACLTTLTIWTRVADSPLLGFFVFHMVFASLLMSRPLAYGAAVVAVGMLVGGLWWAELWPSDPRQRLVIAGWGVTVLLTIYLTNHIMRSLHRHRHRLMVQNRRVRLLLNKLRQQQQVMVQHEKMVGLGQMAAGVAHEINNPLASMDGLMQLMQRNDKHITQPNIALLRQQVDRIQEIVQQLTRFAHPTEYTWQTTGLNELVELALQVVRFDRRQRQVPIERQFSAQESRVHVQPHAVQQALVNILLNALDATAAMPDPRITVSTACTPTELRLTISDNGPGIPPENLQRIFEPFFTTKPVGQGTGLGLAISYNLIRNQGGIIEVTSVPGQGTIFVIVLPQRK